MYIYIHVRMCYKHAVVYPSAAESVIFRANHANTITADVLVTQWANSKNDIGDVQFVSPICIFFGIEFQHPAIFQYRGMMRSFMFYRNRIQQNNG